jgi:hypothetical protein
MKYVPSNTLAYYQAAPQFKARNHSTMLLSSLAQATKIYRAEHPYSMPVPDNEAIEFYGLSHLVSIIRSKFSPSEVLPELERSVMDHYVTVTSQQGLRQLHYMMCIISREARHQHDINSTLKTKLNAIHPELFTLINSLRSAGEEGAVGKYTKYSGKITAEEYVRGIALCYDTGSWSGGYGGPPWGMIAKCALSFLQGHTSIELMVDVAYALAHNNGPMYNKGMLYQGYTGHFKLILDVQRSGQIPELLLDPHDWINSIDRSSLVTPNLVKAMHEKYAGEYGEWVDWQKVEDLGALNQYATQKMIQNKAHAKPVVVKFMGKPAKIVGEFEVFPGQKVPVLKRA